MDAKTKKFVLIGACGIVIILLLVISFLFSRSKSDQTQTSEQTQQLQSEGPTANPSQPRVWQVSLAYNAATQQLALERIVVRNGTTNPGSSDDSAFHAIIVGKNNKALDEQPIHINETIAHFVQSLDGKPVKTETPSIISSLVVLPYYPEATRIIITQNDQFVIDFTPPH